MTGDGVVLVLVPSRGELRFQATPTKQDYCTSLQGFFFMKIYDDYPCVFLYWNPPGLHYFGEIYKSSLNSTAGPTVNPSRKRSFSKTLFKLIKFENVSFAFSCKRQTFGSQGRVVQSPINLTQD